MNALRLLRTIAATVGAVVEGAVTLATGAGHPGHITLNIGDLAPDFTLPASDGRTYRLTDVVAGGRPVVIAWFPKAFTGG